MDYPQLAKFLEKELLMSTHTVVKQRELLDETTAKMLKQQEELDETTAKMLKQQEELDEAVAIKMSIF
jgi:mannitol/fructose-specific phosphotransferase system IIA component (Ntr-type)